MTEEKSAVDEEKKKQEELELQEMTADDLAAGNLHRICSGSFKGQGATAPSENSGPCAPMKFMHINCTCSLYLHNTSNLCIIYHAQKKSKINVYR